MGYHRAGFDVVGVDHKPQPRYPFEFHQADALEYVVGHGQEFDAIHASPPCQRYSSMSRVGQARRRTARQGRLVTAEHPALIEPTRHRLRASRVPYVIENVEGAPLVEPRRLCGSLFDLAVRRHRLFECSFALEVPRCFHPRLTDGIAVYGQHPEPGGVRVRRSIAVYGKRPGDRLPGGVIRARSLEDGQRAMGISWMEWRELTQAIPPAYTELIGKQLIRAVARAAA